MSAMHVPNTEEISLAKQLGAPEKHIRDKAVRGLVAFLAASGDVSDLDMLKFWKCLYYCLWLSDKAPIQHELAMSLANLLHACPSNAKAMQFLTAFFRTILREWAHLDQYRVNKFYALLRFVLRQTFHFLLLRKWAKDITEDVLSVMQAEVFNKTPNGPRLHYADIYLAELLEVTKGTLSTRNIVCLLEPMIDILVGNTDNAFKDRVAEKVFGAYLDEFAAEAKTDKEAVVFAQVHTTAIQQRIFSAASDEDTREGNRKRLYDAHKLFQKATKIDFVVEDHQEKEGGRKLVADKSSAVPAAKKEGKRKREDVEVSELVVERKTSKPAKEVKVSPPVVVSKTAKAAAKEAKVSTPVTENNTAKPMKEATSDFDIGLEFLAAKKFCGRYVGYVFKKGDKGIGYYRDHVQASKVNTSSKSKTQNAPAGNKAGGSSIKERNL